MWRSSGWFVRTPSELSRIHTLLSQRGSFSALYTRPLFQWSNPELWLPAKRQLQRLVASCLCSVTLPPLKKISFYCIGQHKHPKVLRKNMRMIIMDNIPLPFGVHNWKLCLHNDLTDCLTYHMLCCFKILWDIFLLPIVALLEMKSCRGYSLEWKHTVYISYKIHTIFVILYFHLMI